MYVVYLLLNVTYWIQGSSAAVPITTLLALLGLWIGVSLPLTFIGAFLGQRKGVSHYIYNLLEHLMACPGFAIICNSVPGADSDILDRGLRFTEGFDF